MDIKALDKALLEIVKKREELSKIDYNNPKYDDLEEKLHDLGERLHLTREPNRDDKEAAAKSEASKAAKK